ncbi:MAG: ThuA domain-containing protein [Verrucomicrobia bacterium]|nr:ThuA domain-containing protein [Verrucomicrobiota bacterium]
MFISGCLPPSSRVGDGRIPRRAGGFLLLAGLACLAAQPALAEESKLRVLILSGANNHNWRETTPAIKAALEETGCFSVDVEEKVASLKPQAFEPYAVILSDFNTFGQDASVQVWDAAMKKAFIEHLQKGHGLVIVHAGSSGFYDWPEFQKLACGSWGAATSHGPIHVDRIHFTDVKSPITAGLEPFWIRDEFWKDVGVAPGVKALAYVPSLTTTDKDLPKTANILFTTEVAGARGFAIFLGHDATAMKNTAWRTLLQRGTEWAATNKVTLPPAKDWPATQADAERMAK